MVIVDLEAIELGIGEAWSMAGIVVPPRHVTIDKLKSKATASLYAILHIWLEKHTALYKRHELKNRIVTQQIDFDSCT